MLLGWFSQPMEGGVIVNSGLVWGSLQNFHIDSVVDEGYFGVEVRDVKPTMTE